MSAEEYGRIKSTALSQGKPIPENDMWIAAIARANGFALVTADKHFSNIPDLNVIKI